MGRFHPDQRYVWVSENDSMKLALGEMWELRQKNLISRVSCSLKMIYWPEGCWTRERLCNICEIFIKLVSHHIVSFYFLAINIYLLNRCIHITRIKDRFDDLPSFL